MDQLLREIRNCIVCKNDLPNYPRPIVQASTRSKIVIIGQAPGQRVQNSGIPWDDPSGDELRRWLGITKDLFYDAGQLALIPMGFCYPGKGTSGDLPPRPACAPLWHEKLLNTMPGVQLILLIGKYAQDRYLVDLKKEPLTAIVKNFDKHLPYLPLVHPSPRNNIWQRKNPWFKSAVVPFLQSQVQKIIGGS